MGLAAPQARLLMLTSRKNDVEARLMTVANQKIALARSSSDASQKYQQALNATKLVWSADGTNSDLYYDLFDPTINDGYYYMLSDTASGATILNQSEIDNLSLGKASGTGSDFSAIWGEDSFIAKMLGGGVSTSDVTTAKEELQIGNADDEYLPFTTNYSDVDIYTYLANECSIGTSAGAYSYIGSETPNVVLISNYDKSDNNAVINAVAGTVGGICYDVASALESTLEDLYGTDYKDVEEQILKAESYARQQTIQYYRDIAINGNGAIDGVEYFDGYDDDGNAYNAQVGAAGYNGITASKYSQYLDANEVIKVYLNYFDAACADINDDNTLNHTDGSQYSNNVNDTFEYYTATTTYQNGTDSGGYPIYETTPYTTTRYAGSTDRYTSGGTGENCTVGAIDGTYTTGSGVTILSDDLLYYQSLYKEMAASGWETFNTTNDENAALQTLLTYGSYTIKEYSSNNNGWDGLGVDSALSPVSSEICDDTADAEAEYDAEMDKIEYKESIMDVESNNLESERSEVTSEIESVNNVLKQHFDDFKLFQTG